MWYPSDLKETHEISQFQKETPCMDLNHKTNTEDK